MLLDTQAQCPDYFLPGTYPHNASPRAATYKRIMLARPLYPKKQKNLYSPIIIHTAKNRL
ncbi:hypothetical protein CVU75_01570 [Candidatus Dependentiae bacterium HGW-Dependentiae-1]|nr:MAG: hypothetical protein CVU75_01570 [Candidatus Dependentiae bacterium HGW-Dependentiae-1]